LTGYLVPLEYPAKIQISGSTLIDYISFSTSQYNPERAIKRFFKGRVFKMENINNNIPDFVPIFF